MTHGWSALAVSWVLSAGAIAASLHDCSRLDVAQNAVAYSCGCFALVAAVAAVSKARRQVIGELVLVSIGVSFSTLAVVATMPGVSKMCSNSNESSALGDLREAMSSEAGYMLANEGFYDRPACLREPWRCIPDHSTAAPALAGPWLQPERSGYRFTYYPGARATEVDRSRVSWTSVKTYAYVAEPVVPGFTGRRGFCVDDRGIYCATGKGSSGLVTAIGGRCPADLALVGAPGSCGARRTR